MGGGGGGARPAAAPQMGFIPGEPGAAGPARPGPKWKLVLHQMGANSSRSTPSSHEMFSCFLWKVALHEPVQAEAGSWKPSIGPWGSRNKNENGTRSDSSAHSSPGPMASSWNG